MPETILSIPSKILDGSIVHDTIEEMKANFNADSHAMAQKTTTVLEPFKQNPKTTPLGSRYWLARPVIEITDPLIGDLPNERLFKQNDIES